LESDRKLGLRFGQLGTIDAHAMGAKAEMKLNI